MSSSPEPGASLPRSLGFGQGNDRRVAWPLYVVARTDDGFGTQDGHRHSAQWCHAIGRKAVSERVEELYGRWQALQLLSPVFELTKRAAPRAGFDHSRYDLGQLALRAIDQIVVAQASLVGSVSPERLTDHLRGVAQRMAPDDPTRPWQQVATTTLNTLLNDGNPHEATWVDLAGNGDEWAESRPYRGRFKRSVQRGRHGSGGGRGPNPASAVACG